MKDVQSIMIIAFYAVCEMDSSIGPAHSEAFQSRPFFWPSEFGWDTQNATHSSWLIGAWGLC